MPEKCIEFRHREPQARPRLRHADAGSKELRSELSKTLAPLGLLLAERTEIKPPSPLKR